MKTVPLRTLLRDPLRVKKMTRAGAVVQVTDQGKLLWELRAVESATPNDAEDRELDKFLQESAKMKPATLSLSQILEESRR